jgi:hypothetical protein
MPYPRLSARVTPSLALTSILALTLTPGCDGSDREPVVVTDSAGVAIMVSNRPAWSPDQQWRLADEPHLRVAGVPGQRYYELTNAVDAQVLSDGSVLVTQCSNPPEVRLYGSTGSYVRSWGGEGSGAGQCRFILRTWTAGADTLIIYDPTLSRLNYFHRTGPLIRVVQLSDGPDSLLWIDRFADGALLGRPNQPQPVEEGRSRASFLYSRLDPSTQGVEPLIDALGAEYVVTGTANGPRAAEPVLFAPFTVAVARGQDVILSDTRDFWIEERRSDGSLVRRFSRAWDPTPVDRRFIRDYGERRMAGAGSQVRQVRQELERAIFAESLPAHEPTLLVDATDHLWVLHSAGARGEPRRWSVFAPDGRWLGEVSTPAPLLVTDIGDAHVAGIWRDAGGQAVRVYELHKPS